MGEWRGRRALMVALLAGLVLPSCTPVVRQVGAGGQATAAATQAAPGATDPAEHIARAARRDPDALAAPSPSAEPAETPATTAPSKPVAHAVAVASRVIPTRVGAPQAPAPAAGVPEAPHPPPGPPDTMRVQVPEVGIDLPVVPGDGVHVAPFEAALYPYLSSPGSGQRSLIYAHARKGMFGGLFNARPGDHVNVVRPHQSTLHYLVSAYYPSWPVNDYTPLVPAMQEQLVLMTCTTYNLNDPRQIVIANPI